MTSAYVPFPAPLPYPPRYLYFPPLHQYHKYHKPSKLKNLGGMEKRGESSGNPNLKKQINEKNY